MDDTQKTLLDAPVKLLLYMCYTLLLLCITLIFLGHRRPS